jgi:regulator of protease activity HflC (stomatin/prohibitin superfamily)
MDDKIPKPDPGLETGETGTDVSTQALTQALRGGFVILYIVILILAGYFLASNSARVKPGASTVVLRFGRPLQTSKGEVLTEGKMVWAWPRPIDEKVDITGGTRSVFSTVGWYGAATGANAQFNPDRDRYVLTRDWNILHVQMELRYEVEDPIRYNFGFFKDDDSENSRGVETVLELALNNAIVLTASVFEANEILDTIPVDVVDGEKTVSMVFKKAVAHHLGRLVAEYDLGIGVESVEFISAPVLPRGKVAIEDAKLRQKRAASSDALNEAIEKARTLKNQARVGADNIIKKAESESGQLAEKVKNEFAEFNSLWDNFKDDPEGLQLELEKRLRDTVRGIMSDPSVEITKLPAGVAGGRPKVKLVVRRLRQRGPEAMEFEGDPDGGSQKAPGPN